MSSLTSLLSQITKALLGHPIHFITLQTLAASTEILEWFLTPQLEKNGWMAIALLLLWFCIASVLSSALTFASVMQTESKGAQFPLLSVSISRVREKITILIPAAFLVGVVCVLGFAAMLLPGIYFATLYLFVTPLIMIEPKTNLTVYLHRSSQLSKKNLMRNLTLVATMLVLALGGYLSGTTLSSAAVGITTNTILQVVIHILIRVLFSACLGAFIDVSICYYFLDLRRLEAHT